VGVESPRGGDKSALLSSSADKPSKKEYGKGRVGTV